MTHPAARTLPTRSARSRTVDVRRIEQDVADVLDHAAGSWPSWAPEVSPVAWVRHLTDVGTPLASVVDVTRRATSQGLLHPALAAELQRELVRDGDLIWQDIHDLRLQHLRLGAHPGGRLPHGDPALLAGMRADDVVALARQRWGLADVDLTVNGVGPTGRLFLDAPVSGEWRDEDGYVTVSDRGYTAHVKVGSDGPVAALRRAGYQQVSSVPAGAPRTAFQNDERSLRLITSSRPVLEAGYLSTPAAYGPPDLARAVARLQRGPDRADATPTAGPTPGGRHHLVSWFPPGIDIVLDRGATDVVPSWEVARDSLRTAGAELTTTHLRAARGSSDSPMRIPPAPVLRLEVDAHERHVDLPEL